MSFTPPFLALDPGSSETAYVVYDTHLKKPVLFKKVLNVEIFDIIQKLRMTVVCEFPFPRGQLPSWQTFRTCSVAGRFQHVTESIGEEFIEMDRDHIKTFVTGSRRSKDPQVRAALLKRFGGESALGGGKCKTCKGKGTIGRKKEPCKDCSQTGENPKGILHGMAADVWAALAVAVTYAEDGPSKKAEELQADRKVRKANQKEEWALKLTQLRETLEQLNRTIPPVTSYNQADKLAKRIASTQKQISRLELKLTPKCKKQ